MNLKWKRNLFHGVLIVLLIVVNWLAFQSQNSLETTSKKAGKAKSSASNTPTDTLAKKSPKILADSLVKQAASPPKISPLEQQYLAAGLVDAQTERPDLQVDLRYASQNNFLEKNVYGSINKCYLQADVVKMLAKAQALLKEQQPDYSLLLLDCTRPLSVQHQMWDIVKGTEEARYVASPYGGGSMHNYGTAVDLTIANAQGEQLDMGTPFDFFGPLAQPRYHQQMLAEGKLNKQQVQNRMQLRNLMKKAGFRPIDSEWWHFGAYRKQVVREKYKIVE